MSDSSSRIFSELFSSVAGSQMEDEFMNSFFKVFPNLFQQQQQVNKSTRVKNDEKTIYTMKFKDISIELTFIAFGLLEAIIKLPKDEFINVKQYLQNTFRTSPFVKELFGTVENTKIPDFNVEVNFARLLLFGNQVTIKRINN